MERIYRDADVDLGVLKGRTIGVIGYGIQGKAQAANARDSGCRVIVGARPAAESTSQAQAKADGFEAFDIAEAVKLPEPPSLDTPTPPPAVTAEPEAPAIAAPEPAPATPHEAKPT